MKTPLIQKQLNDFKCFKDHYTKTHLTVFDNEGHCTFEERDIDTDRILVLADNPYQLCIAVQDTNNHGKIYHIDEKADMAFDFLRGVSGGYTIFKDKDHELIFDFFDKDWKNAKENTEQ